jgi:hypothetical protein
MPTESDYADRWRRLAREAVAAAHEMRDPKCKRALFFIAEVYNRLADRARSRKNVRR